MHFCKICHSKTETLIDEKKNLYYYRCINCGFVYLDNRAIIDNDIERKHYEKHNNTFECQGYIEMFEKFIKTIKSYLSNPNSVLDFGCGEEAVLSQLLKEKGLEVDIYDIYFHPKRVYKDKKYDVILSTEVFEHLKEPKKILKELVDALEDKGYIILMTKFPPSDDKEFLAWWYRRDITHISFFTPKSFELMAEAFGLKVLETINDNIVVFQKC